MIVPRVKSEKIKEKSTLIGTALTLAAPEEHFEKAKVALEAFLPSCTVSRGAEDAVITAQADARFEGRPEAYCLTAEKGRVRIGFSGYLGLRNALAVFSLLVTLREGGLELPDAEIEDEPEASFRSAMLEVAFVVKPMRELMDDLVLMAKARMNYAQIYFSDHHGVAIRLETLPEEIYNKEAYTKDEIRELCRFAGAIGIELIPQFDMPAHTRLMVKYFDFLQCELPEGVEACNWAACTGDPRTYELYERIIREILDIFPGRYFHMGGDELEMLDLGAICQWDECAKCRRLRREHNIPDKQEQYYYFVRRIYDIVKAEGRELIMWSDQLDCPRGAELPQDIIMEFWRVAHPGRGPYVGCSLNAQAALGYKVINAFYPYTYTFTGDPGEKCAVTPEKLAGWIWNREPDVDEENAGNIIGGELCAWGYTSALQGMDYIRYIMPSLFVLLGDKLWNNDRMVYDVQYCRGLTRCLLGEGTPDGLDVFGCIGSVMPPTEIEGAIAYPERVSLTVDELRAVDGLLEGASLSRADRARAEIYRECIGYVIDKKQG